MGSLISGYIWSYIKKSLLIQHFIQENASYYTEIEKVTGFDQAKLAYDLPGEIVETVNKFTGMSTLN